MYYLKVALITLIVSIGLAELIGPRFGLNGYLMPNVKKLANQQLTKSEVRDSGVTTLKLTSEKGEKNKSKPKQTDADQAYEICYKNIKSVSLFPEFTRIPRMAPVDSKGLFQFEWGKINPVRSLNTRGAEVSTLISCQIEKASGYISFLQIDKQILANSLSSSSLIGVWKIDRILSDIDNSTNVFVSAPAANIIKLNSKETVPELVINCRENTTRFHIAMGQNIGTGSVDVKISIDGTDAFLSQWNYSSDKQGITPQEHHIGLLQLMLNAHVMKASFKSTVGTLINIDFSLDSLSAAIYPLKKACHWK